MSDLIKSIALSAIPTKGGKDFVTPTGNDFVTAGPTRDEIRAKSPDRGVFGAINDNVIEIANAAAGGVSSIANMVSPGNRVSKFIEEEIIKPGEESQSDAVKAEKRFLRDSLENAQGATDEIGAYLSYIASNPGLAISQVAGSFAIPGIAARGATKLAGAAGLGQKAASRFGLGAVSATSGAMAGGDAAGSAYDLVKRTPKKVLEQNAEYQDLVAQMGEEQALEEIATRAARNASALPAAIGATLGPLGAERILAGAGRAKTASRVKNAGITGGIDAGTEGFEEGATQYSGQKAASEYNPTIDPMKGVAGAATMGAVMGAGPGLVAGALEAPAVPNPLQPVADKAAEPNSPLSKAALAGATAQGVLQQATAVLPEETAPVAPPAGAEIGNTANPMGPGPSADPYARKAAELEQIIRSQDLVRSIRTDGAGLDGIMFDLQTLRDPNAREDIKQAAQQRLEEEITWAQTNWTPKPKAPAISEQPGFEPITSDRQPASGEVLGLEVVQASLRDPQLGPKISETDRQNILQLTQTAQNPSLPLGTRQRAAQQAIEIVGLYRAAAEPVAREQSVPAEPALVSPDSQQTVAQSEQTQPAVAQTEQRTPAGTGPATFRRRGETLAQLVSQGFETVERREGQGGGFFLKNSKTGAEIKLDGMADAAMARNLIQKSIRAQADQSPNSPRNDLPESTEAQNKAGNYKKPPVSLNGFTIRVENPAGSVRRGVDKDGTAWESEMKSDYGYIENTKAKDGDGVDVVIGNRSDSGKIFVIDQVNPDGSFDEPKVVMGVTDEDHARRTYLSNYEPGWTGLGAITEMTREQFNDWLKSGGPMKATALGKKAAAQPAAEQGDQKARWIKAITDQNRLAGSTGIQLDVTEDGKLNFLGDPNSTKQGRQLLATLEEARKAGATNKEIADAIRATRQFSQGVDNKRQGAFNTLEEAKQYLSQQRRANGSVSGLPLQLSDGSFTVAAKGTPQYAEAERQRDAQNNAQQGDFFEVRQDGKPRRLRKAKKSELPRKASPRRMGEMRPISQDEATVLERVAGLLGKKVVFFEATDGRLTDAFVIPGQSGTIYIATSTTVNPLALLGHEFYHTLRMTNPEAWSAIAAVVRGRVTDPKGFRADYYGDERANAAGDAALSGEVGGELEELVSDLGGNLMLDQTFWQDVMLKIAEDNGDQAKGIIARMIATFNDFMARVLNAMEMGGYRADNFVDPKELDAIKQAFTQATADFIKQSGMRQSSLAAEVKRAEQDIRKSTDKSDKGLTVEGYHFSQEPRAVLSTGMFGTGLKGSAREEIMNADDARLRQRLYFYVDKGTGIKPEAGVGGYAHKATLTGIYDADADPLRLRGGNARAFESKVLDAGFKGYLSRLEGTQSGQVILLGAQTVRPELLGTGKVTGAKVVPQPQQREADLGDRIMAAQGLPAGSLAPARWAEVLMAQEPELAAQLLDIGALEGEQAMFKDELAGRARALSQDVRMSADRARTEYAEVEAQYKGTDAWLKAPNGNPTNLSERQWVQVRTPSFKKWFGDWEKHATADNPVGSLWSDDTVSKAVDKNGEPLVVYHGTDKGGFTSFEQPGGTGRGDLGIWTTPNYGMARSYVRKGRARDVELTAMPSTREELEELGFTFFEQDDGTIEVDTPSGYTENYDNEQDAIKGLVENYAEDIDANGAGTQPGIYALFIDIKNPNEDNFQGALWTGDREDQYQVRDENDEPVYDEEGRSVFGYSTAEDLVARNPGAELQPADPHYNTTDDVVREARRYNNDGAIIREVIDDGGGVGYDLEPSDIFVAFDPRQVKSADYNNGEFSDSTGDIRRSAPRKAAKRPAQDPAIGDKTDVSKLPEGKAIPADVAVGSLEGSLKQAASKSYRRGRELKQDIQDRVLAAARAAKVNLSQRTQATFRFLADMVISDAKFALKSNENAVGWYDQKVSRAIGALSTMHPEIESDPRSRLAFLWALATTSNGVEVGDNFRLAERAYRGWKATGKMPTDIGIGNAASNINKGLALYNELTEKVGDERLLKFMSTKFTVGEIANMLGVKPGGEWMGTPVRGASILGPKIGNGFFSNLNGYFDALTMDRWLMRTWGRMTGTLLINDPAAITKGRKELYSAIKALSAKDRRTLSDLIGKPVKAAMTKAELDAVAIASQKASMKPEKREVMMATPLMDKFRKTANNHQKAMDGQKEAPGGPAERNWIRAVFQDALEKLQAEGKDMTMSDLQALLWYPERRLYDAAKADEEIEAGYEDDEAPDYANAAQELAMANGVSKTRVLAAMDAAEARGTVVGKPLTDAEKQAMLDEFRAPPEQQYQIAFEAAPNPDDEVATSAWNRLTDKDKKKITELARDAVLADMIDAVGLKVGKGVTAMGGFEGQVNPNVIAGYKPSQVSIDDARVLSAAVGIALEQKSVALVDGRASQTNGLIRITLGEKAEKHVRTVMGAIAAELGLTDFTARGNNIDILNFTDTPTEELAGKIEQVLDGIDSDLEAAVSFGDVNSELVEEGSYESQITGSRPETGREILERARRARARAREIIGAELRARSPGQVSDGTGNARRGADEGDIARSVPRDGSGRQEAGRAASGSLEASEQAAAQALKPLPGAPTVQGATGPDAKLVAVAESYARKNGIALRRQAKYIKADPERGKRIADAYAAMAHDPQNPRVKEAYQNLIQQTRAQYDALVDAGYKFWFMDMNLADNQEYASTPWNAMRDLRANQEMGVFPTSDGFGTNEEFTPDSNPLLEDTGLTWPVGSANSKRTAPVLANDLFRAVHDAFGHGLEGAGFRADGEENAWQAHVRLFTGSAVAAITSETRGQNSWLNFGPNGEKNRTAKVEDTVFADQKTGLMPEWTWKEGVVGDMPTDANTTYNQRVAALKDLIACLKK